MNLLPRSRAIPKTTKCRQSRTGLLLPTTAISGSLYLALMAGEEAQMVFTDPPYNVPISEHAGRSGAIQHREFVMASSEMTSCEFTSFLGKEFRNLSAHSADGSIHFIRMDWRHLAEVTVAANDVFGELKNLCVWVKDNGGMGTFYRSRHELDFAFKKGVAPHINNLELGQHGRYRTNVWQYKGVNTLKANRVDGLCHMWTPPVGKSFL
jgi:hypothetical protein